MANIYLIDAHTLLRFLDNNRKLGQQAAQTLNDASTRFLLSAIAMVEALFVLKKGRTPFTITEQELLQAIDEDERITIYPLTDMVIQRMLDCKSISGMHDRQMMATALVI